jgi:TPR repeat protein
VATDVAKAVKSLRKAAQYGHPLAQLLLERYYESGTITTLDVKEVYWDVQAKSSLYKNDND